MASNPVTPTAPAETPDPFKGQETTHAEFSEWRKTGELPERFKEQEAPKPPAAPEKAAETVEGQEPSETEQEKQDRDEAGKFKAKEKEPLFTPDQQKAFDRAFAKREAKLRAEFDSRFAAKTSETPQATPPAKEAAAAPETNEPMPPDIPNLNTWTGTIEEYDAAVKGYPAKLKAFLDVQRGFERQQEARAQHSKASQEATLSAHPDYKEKFEEFVEDLRSGVEQPFPPHVFYAIDTSEDPHGITNYLISDRDELHRFHSLSPQQALREVAKLEVKLAGAKSPVHAEIPAKAAKPKPPEPVGARASSSAFDVNDEKLSADEWARQRNEQLAKRRSG